MAILIGFYVTLGLMAIAAAGYRAGHRAGIEQGKFLADQWRDTALSLVGGRAEQLDALRDASIANAQEAAAYKRRANAMGDALRALGYQVLEIEDPKTGQIGYQVNLVQPAARLPLGPSMS